MEPNDANLAHISMSLAAAGISLIDEYPKAMYRPVDRTKESDLGYEMQTVGSADEEHGLPTDGGAWGLAPVVGPIVDPNDPKVIAAKKAAADAKAAKAAADAKTTADAKAKADAAAKAAADAKAAALAKANEPRPATMAGP
jgi:hypothetical protein